MPVHYRNSWVKHQHLQRSQEKAPPCTCCHDYHVIQPRFKSRHRFLNSLILKQLKKSTSSVFCLSTECSYGCQKCISLRHCLKCIKGFAKLTNKEGTVCMDQCPPGHKETLNRRQARICKPLKWTQVNEKCTKTCYIVSQSTGLKPELRLQINRYSRSACFWEVSDRKWLLIKPGNLVSRAYI
jgi:hypothetical protein